MADELIKRADIITKANVKDAVAECDRLGRDGFLDYVNTATKDKLGADAYRLVKSRNHRLFYKGKYYDTKPIVQCAFIKAIGDDDPDRYDWGFWGGLGDRNRAAQLLIDLGFEVVSLADNRVMEQEEKADKEEQKINDDPKRSPTTKKQLIKARRGQGKYRNNLLKVEKCCRVTKVKNPVYLIASHIKPWCESNDKEKLDGNNGLLLAPHIDRLFDQGYISFTDGGRMLVADKSAGNEDLAKTLELWHIDRRKNYGDFSPKQRRYLAYHRYRIYRGRVMRPRRSQR